MRNRIWSVLVAGTVVWTVLASKPGYSQMFNGQSLSDNSEISLAIIANDVAAVEKLLSAGLDPMKPARFEHPRWFQGKPTEFQPILSASLFGRTEILKRFYQSGRVNKANPLLSYILCTGLIWGNEEANLYLLDQGAVVNPLGGCVGRGAPLDIALFNGIESITTRMVKAGAKSGK